MVWMRVMTAMRCCVRESFCSDGVGDDDGRRMSGRVRWGTVDVLLLVLVLVLVMVDVQTGGRRRAQFRREAGAGKEGVRCGEVYEAEWRKKEEEKGMCDGG